MSAIAVGHDGTGLWVEEEPNFVLYLERKAGDLMDVVLTQSTTSITEFKKNPNESVAQAGNRAFAVLTNNRPSFYVVPPELFERIADIVFDLEITPKLKKCMAESGKAVRVSIDEL